ncbi:INO80 complex subunit E [Pseudolycoriella hygida]|uniref:INO80 complex subunit E n=1 Tax=Pseudolycoriella hygida TaxID=35572 RepID=A0A9Q0S1K8_9DIPT|nr:INO80 complex subunit E [Pseudolycoriella hygida]
MLDGWFCRTVANQKSMDQIDQDEDAQSDSQEDYDPQVVEQAPRVDYKAQYNTLKKKLKFLLYENEFFQDALRSSQRRHLKVTRDRSFLLDRLQKYEKPEVTSSESEDTEDSSDEDVRNDGKKRKIDSAGKNPNPPKKKKVAPKKVAMNQMMNNIQSIDGHMTAEEVERHLKSRQSFMELVPERAPPTVPNEMFSNEPSLDSESNELIETSPSNIGEECLSVEY